MRSCLMVAALLAVTVGVQSGFAAPGGNKPPASGDLFTQLDTSADSKIRLAEYQAACPRAAKAAEAIFKLLDKDGDGFLSLSEFTSRPRQPLPSGASGGKP